MKKLIILILSVAGLSSCIYSYEADLSAQVEQKLVVSGDILIGSMSVITLGYVVPMDKTMAELKRSCPESGSVSVECSDGTEYAGEWGGGGEYTVDLRNAAADKAYRLVVVNGDDGRVYASPWSKVLDMPEITDMKYVKSDDNVSILLSLDGGSDIRYFRWDYEETWEYHADFIPDWMFDYQVAKAIFENPDYSSPAERENPSEIYRPRENTEDYYYCWNSSSNTEYCIAKTESQKDNKVVNLDVMDIPRSSKKLSVLYSILLRVRAMDRNCYGYLNNLKTNSNNSGDLFTPVPSDIRGNIVCQSDTTLAAIGYVCVSREYSRRFFINGEVDGLYKSDYNPDNLLYYPVPDEDRLYNFCALYNMGERPVRLTLGEEVPSRTNMYWAPKRCTDCRESGGTKDKPSYWPNDHK